MKRIYRKDEDAVSPVIATILMVAITVVLAAVLYVMVIGMGDTGSIETPLGLNDSGRTTSTFTILVSNAPDGAKIYGTLFSFTHDNAVTTITNVTVYSAAGVPMAWYDGAWTIGDGGQYVEEWSPGMKLTVTPLTAVSSGDTLTMSSDEAYFGTTQYVI